MMASKKKQKMLCDDAVQNQTNKKSKKSHALTKRLSKVDDNSINGEEDALEMERNFVLFSKKNSVQAPKKHKRELGCENVEEDEKTEEEDNVNAELYPESSSDVSGSDGDDACDNDSDSKPQEENSICAKFDTSSDLQKGLSSMSFEEIMSLQNNVGTKAFNKIVHGTSKRKQTTGTVKRVNKHRPEEISAKKHVPFLRKVVSVKKTTFRDPRFDDLSGEFRPETFKQTYKFIDDIRKQEAWIVKKKLKNVKSEGKKEQLKFLLKRMENQERARRRLEQQREKELEFKKKQKELVGQGHRPFYLKKSDKKKLELAEKYNALKKSGTLENFLSKKRKRNAIKDRRKMPYHHKKN
ncbi:ribosomal RNA processing protein 36 homolog isoform X2 [Hoplias malabaricus]